MISMLCIQNVTTHKTCEKFLGKPDQAVFGVYNLAAIAQPREPWGVAAPSEINTPEVSRSLGLLVRVPAPTSRYLLSFLLIDKSRSIKQRVL